MNLQIMVNDLIEYAWQFESVKCFEDIQKLFEEHWDLHIDSKGELICSEGEPEKQEQVRKLRNYKEYLNIEIKTAHVGDWRNGLIQANVKFNEIFPNCMEKEKDKL